MRSIDGLASVEAVSEEYETNSARNAGVAGGELNYQTTYQLLLDRRKLSTKEAADVLGVTRNTARKHLRRLVVEGLAERIGNEYRLVGQPAQPSSRTGRTAMAQRLVEVVRELEALRAEERRLLERLSKSDT